MLDRPLHLPRGAVLKNRIAKAAMSDDLGDGQGAPTDALNLVVMLDVTEIDLVDIQRRSIFSGSGRCE